MNESIISIIPAVLTKEETAKVAESLIKDTIINILNDLITEAEANPDWKAVNALRCAKKEISNLSKQLAK